jgi:hypothetical protein
MDSGSKSEHNIISCKLQQDDDDDDQGRILNYALVVNNDDCGVTSFDDATINKIHQVISPNHFVAVLLHTQFGFFAAQTGANHASHSHLLPHFELGPWHLGTELHHEPHLSHACQAMHESIPHHPNGPIYDKLTSGELIRVESQMDCSSFTWIR